MRQPLSSVHRSPLVQAGFAFFTGWLIVCSQLHAAEPYDFQWAWSTSDVKNAGEAFWPQFRGPTGDGHAKPGTKLATEWSESTNIRWKIPISGKAWSSPVAWGNTIWLTNASQDGLHMSAMAINRSDGAILWQKEIFANEKVQPDFHEFNSYASPTPVVDDKCVYVSFGAYGTAALLRDSGEIVWQRRDLPCNHFRGAGSSPILFRNMLLFHMDGFDFQYVVALDKHTGQTIWKVDRQVEYGTDDGDIKKAFSTPLLVQSGDRLQMISTTSKCVLSYDPTNGKEFWRARYDEFSSTARPVSDGRMVFVSTGFGKAKMIAVALDGQGEVTNTHIRWESNRAIGSKPSPLLVGDSLITVDDRGVLTAFHQETGKVQWQKRLGGDFSASPIYSDGNIYCFDEQGKAHVYSIGGEEVATNSLDSGCLASPIAAGNDLIVRTRVALYCIGGTK